MARTLITRKASPQITKNTVPKDVFGLKSAFLLYVIYILMLFLIKQVNSDF